MELSRNDSFVVRTEHAGSGFLIEIEAWCPARCAAVAARVAVSGARYLEARGRGCWFQAHPHPTDRGSWLVRGVIRDLQDSACLVRGLEVREEGSGPSRPPN